MNTHRFAWIAAAALGLVACGGEGTPPEISALSYQPDTATVGETVTIAGTLDFADEDGDLDLIAITAIDPDGIVSDLPPTMIQGVDGMTSGTIGIQVFLVVSKAGTYDFDLFVVDADGNESNRLSGVVEAQ